MDSIVTEHDGRLLARIEAEDMLFEVQFDAIEATDVTLRFLRDGEKVGRSTTTTAPRRRWHG